MNLPAINWLAVVLATLSTFVVGSLYYALWAFGTLWERLARVDKEAQKAQGPYPFIVTPIVSLVTAIVLAGAAAIAFVQFGGSFLLVTVLTAVVLWLGFTAARVATHDAFEGRPRLLTVLTIGHEFATVVVMALIIGLFGPAG